MASLPCEYVVTGGKLKCNRCVKPDTEVEIKATHDSGIFPQGKRACTIEDKTPFVNIPSFGKCRVTGRKCVPSLLRWFIPNPASSDNLTPLLVKRAWGRCLFTGRITIEDSGQVAKPGEGDTAVLDEFMGLVRKLEEANPDWSKQDVLNALAGAAGYTNTEFQAIIGVNEGLPIVSAGNLTQADVDRIHEMLKHDHKNGAETGVMTDSHGNELVMGHTLLGILAGTDRDPSGGWGVDLAETGTDIGGNLPLPGTPVTIDQAGDIAGVGTHVVGVGVDVVGYGVDTVGVVTDVAGYGVDGVGVVTDVAGYGVDGVGAITDGAGYVVDGAGAACDGFNWLSPVDIPGCDNVHDAGDAIHSGADTVYGVGDNVHGAADTIYGVGDNIHGAADTIYGVGDQVHEAADTVHTVGGSLIGGMEGMLDNIDNLPAATLSGDLGQSAAFVNVGQNVGTGEHSYIGPGTEATYAEIIGDIDGMIIGEAIGPNIGNNPIGNAWNDPNVPFSDFMGFYYDNYTGTRFENAQNWLPNVNGEGYMQDEIRKFANNYEHYVDLKQKSWISSLWEDSEKAADEAFAEYQDWLSQQYIQEQLNGKITDGTCEGGGD